MSTVTKLQTVEKRARANAGDVRHSKWTTDRDTNWRVPNAPVSAQYIRQMIAPAHALATLIALGAASAAALAPRLRRADAARLARNYVTATSVLMAARIAAYIAANAFGANAFRSASTGPYDLTNLLIGALYGLVLVHALGGGFGAFFRSPEVETALRIATGSAFVLAGLGGLLFLNASHVDYFLAVGYPTSFHFVIIFLEVLGGAALLVGWRWLTLVVAAGLAIDMFGALITNVRTGAPLDPAAVVMLLRLAPLALITARGRWRVVSVAGIACALAAFAGSRALMHCATTQSRGIPASCAPAH
jgi:hypothetical protein